MITAKQMHYTSCRFGTTGSSGFQVRAASLGLAPEAIDQVKPWCNYREPNGAPSGDGEARPLSFSSYPLGEDRFAITLVHGTGADYSGRPGNFFAHSLIFAPGAMTAPPLAFLPWSGWVRYLDPKEDVSPPEPLPELSLDYAGARTRLLASVKAFLSLDPRLTVAADIVAALLLHPRSGRPVVVRDQAENGVLWIATAQAILPLSWTLRLPMSTYQYDARTNNAVLACTTSGTQYAFTAAERSGSYAGFDLVEGKTSERATYDQDAFAKAHDFAERLVEWAMAYPDRLAAFQRFADDGFRPAEIDADAACMLRLFEVKRGSAAALPASDLPATIDYVRANARIEAIAGPLDAVATAALNAQPQDAQAAWPALVDLFAWASRAADDPGLGEKACRLWIATFCRNAVHEPHLLPGSAAGLESLLARVPGISGLLWRAVLSPETLDAVGAVRAATPEQAHILIDILLRALAEARASYDAASPVLEALLPAVASHSDLAARLVRERTQGLASPADQARLLAAVHDAVSPARTETTAASNSRLFEEFGRIVSGTRGAPLRTELTAGAFDGFMGAYFTHRLQSAPDSIAAFDNLAEVFLNPFPEFAARMFPALSTGAREVLKGHDYRLLAAHWIERDFASLLPEDLLRDAVEATNAMLRLGNTSRNAPLVGKIDTLAQQLGLALKPDMPLLIRYCETASGVEDAQSREVATAHALCLGLSDYREFLAKVLPRRIAGARDTSEHRHDVLALRAPRHEESFFDIYDKALREIADAPKPLMVALDHWLLLPDRFESDVDLVRWRERMIEACVEAARRLPKESWERLSPDFARRIGSSESAMRDEWRGLQDRIVLARRTLREKVADRMHSFRELVSGLSGRGTK